MQHMIAKIRQFPTVLTIIFMVCVGVELLLLGADHKLWGAQSWRRHSYENGAFWVGLLYGWAPVYPGQPVAMFATYAFLHTGLKHMLGNMLILIFVGPGQVRRVGGARFLLLYAASVLGGAIGFALMTDSLRPMVGASGALFGLVGALVVWDISDTLRVRPGLKSLAYAILWPILLLSALNYGSYWAAAGNLAWETHLGGLLAGAIVAPFLDRNKPTPRGD